MERLTKRIDENHACFAMCENECPYGIYDDNPTCMCEAATKALKKLIHYKEMEEQGKLLILLCKPGDTVYVITPKYNICERMYDCEDYDSEQYLAGWCENYCTNGYKGIGVIKKQIISIRIYKDVIYYEVDRVGFKKKEDIYLTEQEASKALERMK